jgi:hypothetical protein
VAIYTSVPCSKKLKKFSAKCSLTDCSFCHPEKDKKISFDNSTFRKLGVKKLKKEVDHVEETRISATGTSHSKIF